MPKKSNGRVENKQGEVQQVAKSVPVPTKVAAPKLPRKMPVINTAKVQSPGDQANAMQLASSVVSNVLQEVKHKKKNKKKKLFGKIGDFLSGALDKALSIAPAIIHTLAGGVADDWAQGSHTRQSLRSRARQVAQEHLASTVPRSLAPVTTPSSERPTFVVSRRNASLHPNLAENLKGVGVQMLPLPNTTFSAPVTSGMKMSSSFRMSGVNHKKLGAGLRIMGADYVDDVITNGPEARGVLKSEIDLNPARWDGTRIARYAAMYERFEINSLSMVYTPACSTATTGSLVGWFDYDPTDDAGESRDTVVRAIGSIGQDNSPVWAAHCAHFRRDPEQFDYYVDPDGSDDRLTSAGTYRLNVLSALNTVAGTAYGTLTMIYDVSFFVPSVQQAIPGPGPEYKALVDTATSTAATPMGTAPAVDTDNTMDLEYAVLSPSGSGFSGFQGSKSMPGSYLLILDFSAAAGITGCTVTGGTNITFLSGAAGGIANAAGTRMIQLVVFTVNQPVSDDPSQTFVKITSAGAVLTGGSVRFFRVATGVQSTRKLTLQDYEQKTLDMAQKLDDVYKKIEALTKTGSTSTAQLQKCWFCGDDNPDHIGSRCPKRSFAAPSPVPARAMPPSDPANTTTSAGDVADPRAVALQKILDLVSNA